MAKFKKITESTLDDGKKIKNFFWEVLLWGMNEETGKWFAEVNHYFIDGEDKTSNIGSRRYEGTTTGALNLPKIEVELMKLSQFNGSNEQ